VNDTARTGPTSTDPASPQPASPAEAQLNQVLPGIHAWIQPDGSWWLNNAGAVVGDDGALVIDTWNTIGLLAQTSAALNWAAGSKHDVRLEYQEVSGNARVHLYWQVPGGGFVIIPAAQLERSGNGLTGEYFANNSLAESPVLTRYETPNFDWGGGSPDPSLPDNDFSARWSGSLSPPADGQYVFQTVSDDGVRLWLNGALVIDNWTAHAPTTNTSPTIQLATGYRYDIKLEFQELGGGAVMQLSWLPPGASVFSAVPNQVLSGN